MFHDVNSQLNEQLQ